MALPAEVGLSPQKLREQSETETAATPSKRFRERARR
jgi:hypothetical protein